MSKKDIHLTAAVHFILQFPIPFINSLDNSIAYFFSKKFNIIAVFLSGKNKYKC